MRDKTQTIRVLNIIRGCIDEYTRKTSGKNKLIHGYYIPTDSLGIDGRTLRGLERRELLRLTPQNNGARDRRYLSVWYDVTLTTAGADLARQE